MQGNDKIMIAHARNTETMTIFVSLLRGINVGPNTTVKMVYLVVLYRSLGLENIRTYLRGGNVLFEGKVPEPDTLAVTIEESLTLAAGFPVKVLGRGEYRAEEENAYALVPIIQTKPGMPLIKGERTRVWKR